MRFGVLGPTTVWTDDGAVVPVSGVKVRALLTHLALHVGTPVTADRLIEDLWDEPTRRNPAGALSAKVSQLRRALEDAEPGGRTLVVSPPPGYRLDVDPGAVDAVEFERLVAGAQAGSDARRTVRTLERALALWRGPVCAEFADAEFTRPTVTRLDDLWLTAHETLAAARLDVGEHAQVVDGLAELVAAHPWRERLRLAHALALYRCGRQQEALAAIDGYRRDLADELGLDPGPEIVRLRGAILAQDPALTPRRRARPVSNLPGPGTALVGRDDAVAELAGLLPTTRLTTLTGPGGVGKTSLALDVARRSAFESGGWLVELAAVERGGSRDSPTALADLVLATLGIRQVGDEPDADPVDRLAGALRESHTLLVLDNCEQVVESVATLVDRLLRGTRDVVVLATSREPLGLTGETVWTVPPLAVPASRDQRDVDAVGRSPAVRLFVARAKAADRSFELAGWNAAMVGTLCRRLDGIPLALELAATRVATLGVPELLARLGDRFRLLAGARRDAPARHQTLAAVIEWSWELLTPAEQAVLRRLSAHADGCALDAAEATCDGPDVPAESVVDVLARLVERSLVVAVHGRAGTRYRLLESVADYAAARSRDAGEVAAQRERHRRYYADLAARAAPHLTGHDQQAWFTRLDEESANLRAAVETAAVDGDAADALRVVASVVWFWVLRGRIGEARELIDVALAIPGAAASQARADCLTWRVTFAARPGDTTHLPRLRAEALAAFDGLAVPAARARAVTRLGIATFDAGNATTGEAMLIDGCRASAECDDAWGEALALVSLAKVAHTRGDLAELARTATRARRLFGEVGDRWGHGEAADWLCALAEMTGELGKAREIAEAGLRDAEELGLWPSVAGRLGWLGWLAMERGDLAEARQFGAEAHAMATERGSAVTDVFTTMVVGFAARRAGDLDEAERHLGRLRDAAAGATDTALPHLPAVLTELGHVAELRGNVDAARSLHVQALDLALTHGYPRDVAMALEGAASALVAAGDCGTAARVLAAARAHREAAALPPTPAERAEIDRTAARAGSTPGTALSPGEALRLLKLS